MSAKNRAKSAAVLCHSYGLDEATKAGIGACACSMLILGIVLLAMQLLPVSIG